MTTWTEETNQSRSAKMKARWADPKARAAMIESRKQAALRDKNGYIAPAPKRKRHTIVSCMIDAQLALIKILSIPVDVLKTEMADPLQVERMRRESLRVSNFAEEILSLIEHVKRTQDLQR